MKLGKKAGWLVALTVSILVIGLFGYGVFYVLPYLRAKTVMAEDTYFTLTARPQGGIELCWTAVDCDGYAITVLCPGTGEVLWQGGTEAPCCVLPQLDTAEPVQITVNSWKRFTRLGNTETCMGHAPAELVCSLDMPRLSGLGIEPDPAAGTARLRWEDDGNTVLLRAELAGETRELGTCAGDALLLRFDGGADGLRMPEYGEQYTFTAQAYREGGNYRFYGDGAAAAVLDREALLGRELQLECRALGENRYSLSWAETKGEYYAVQRMDAAGGWQTLAEIDRTGERSYATGRLASFTEHTLRVVAVGGDTLPESDFATVPAETRIFTAESALYAAVWPLKELELYADPDRQEVLGKIPAAACCCVMGEEAEMLQVRWAELCGYVDGNYCLINLPDYIGPLCGYDIKNSYDSLYMVHEFEIAEVTGTVVAGYEHVKTGPGTYLVPLLYPTAKKLIPAARAALADGYRLKIYDSYRPNRATRSIYDLTLAIIDTPLPERPYTDVPVAELGLPRPAEGEEALTYYQLVTNGIYSLGNFLASQGSYHNMGVALDLTLERADNGEELKMQTRMHDLSCYSVLSRNNGNAVLLASYMQGAGFNGLTSEWWHFQDDEIRRTLDLHILMWGGVSAEGWTADDGGWRYRAADGSDHRDCELRLGDRTYRFDAAGYLVVPSE